MASRYVVITSGIILAAAIVGCRSERAVSPDEGDGVPPVPAHVDVAGPDVVRCTDEIVPGLMGDLGYQVVSSEASRAGCVVILEAFDVPEAVSGHVTKAAEQLGYTSTGDVAAKGGRRLTYSGVDGLAVSILMRGEGPVTLQHPEAGSHLELHWYDPNLL